MANLDPNRNRDYVVIDHTTEYGREGVYSGSYEDCQQFLEEQSECGDLLVGYEIVFNWRKEQKT